MAEMSNSVAILVGSFVGAIIVAIFGELVVDVAGFADGSTGQTFVEYAPLILIALGFLGAYTEWS